MPGCPGRTGHAIDRNHARSRSCGLMPALPLFRPGEVVGTFERLGWVGGWRGDGAPHCADQGRRSRDTFHPRPPAGRPWDRVLIAKAGLTVEEFLAGAR